MIIKFDKMSSNNNNRCTYEFKRGEKKGTLCGTNGNPRMQGLNEYKCLCRYHERQILKLKKNCDEIGTKETMKVDNNVKHFDFIVQNHLDDSDEIWGEHHYYPEVPVSGSDAVYWSPECCNY